MLKAVALCCGLLCGLQASAASITIDGDTVRVSQKYHILNVATGMWLTEGDNWGTHASLDSVGTSLQLIANGTGYSVRTQFGSFYMNAASDGVWLDQSTPCKWFFTKVENSDYYTISTDSLNTKQLQWNGSGTKVSVKSAPSTANAEYAQWLLVLDKNMQNLLSSATYEHPVDATFLLNDPNFAVLFGGDNAWEGTSATIGGYRANSAGTDGGNYCAEQYGKTFDSYLQVSDLPFYGVWGVSMQGFNREDEEEQSLGALFYVSNNYAALTDIHTESSVPSDLSGAAKKFVNGKYKTEELRVFPLGKNITIGVKKDVKTNSKDWTSWDNVRLVYYGNDTTAWLKCLQEKVDEAKVLLSDSMLTALARETLESALSQSEITSVTRTKVSLAATRLDKAISPARLTAKRYWKLENEMNEAQTLLAEGQGNDADVLEQAIADAKTIYGRTDISDETIDSARIALRNATVNYQFANSTGTSPKVTTDMRFARGCTMAFGRMTVTGSSIKERGFCYSTHPNPTYTDGHSTDYLSNNGNIYVISDLTPSTIYYMRAYAITSSNAIGYGDVLKVVTLPKANVQFSMRYTGDAADARIEAAALTMCDIWNNLTSITGYNSSIGYASGTPTADCSYGGWMRVGPSTSYQAPGTILHEWLHGIGVGTHSVWWNSDMRSNGNRGYWLGERANEVLRFWDNDNTAQLNGDNQHMWPYGCNGSNEDTHSNVLYYGGTLIAQGLGEDGLAPTGGFASPAYVFNQEDTIKYCITSEDAQYGKDTSFLTINADGTLTWKSVAEPSSLTDDYGWYVKFTPSNSYYQLQHVATGRYVTYSDNDGFTTALRSTGNPSGADMLHLMKGRVDVSMSDGSTQRGYYLIHPQSNITPPTLTAVANGSVSSTSYDLAKSATAQRWVIREMKEVNPTGINGVQVADALQQATQKQTGIYDLSGRRLKGITSPGIYIVNGRKVKY